MIRRSTVLRSFEFRERLPLPSKFSFSAFAFTSPQSLVEQYSAQRAIESSTAKPASVKRAW
jgi:hypothetical protein